jgi:addiction module RelE/StbE family toxin
MKIRWTVPAANQLREIFDYIAAGNQVAAVRTVRHIRNSILQTAQMPNAGRIGRVANTREIVVPGTSYLVAYRILEDMIHVLAIMHAARQWPETL